MLVPGLTSGSYDPATNTWRKLPAAPLQPPTGASGAWTGKELVVAGGGNSRQTFFRDAAAYDPSVGTWRKQPQMPRVLAFGVPALSPLHGCAFPSAVWTCHQMIV
jgi:hypothetical protein